MLDWKPSIEGHLVAARFDIFFGGELELNNNSIEEVCVKIQRLFVMTIAVLCAACAAPIMEPDTFNCACENYGVVLKPNLATNTLDVETWPQGWEKAGKQKGWVGFSPGKSGTITFNLNADPEKPVCTNDPNTSAKWVISKIELSNNGHPQSQKGNNFGTSQTGWIANAFPQMNSANGEIIDSGIGSIAVVVKDLNNHNGNQTAYYQITAKRCSDGHPLMTDPGIGNGGR